MAEAVYEMKLTQEESSNQTRINLGIDKQLVELIHKYSVRSCVLSDRTSDDKTQQKSAHRYLHFFIN